ncbi:STAS-like domain-containing protein [soil metagenome]
MAKRPDPNEVRRFIISNLEEHSTDIVKTIAEFFEISRQAAHAHVAKLVKEGHVISEGQTRKRRYIFNSTEITHRLQLTKHDDEDRAWREFVGPHLSELSDNVQTICYHGFTEIFNNAIDHSESLYVTISLTKTVYDVTLRIHDTGVGIFEKIRSRFRLEDQRQAILELSKGKLTTDPSRHSGEGIYFTSKMFDCFSILSNHLFFIHWAGREDWLIEDRSDHFQGTGVRMSIARDSKLKPSDVYDKYISDTDENEYAFSKTHVPLSLAIYGNENLISRSQAKRVLRRFERFKEVMLDFDGVESVGQAFTDEIFRVFYLANPDINVYAINASDQVRKMIRRAISAREDTPKSLPSLDDEAVKPRRARPKSKPTDSD